VVDLGCATLPFTMVACRGMEQQPTTLPLLLVFCMLEALKLVTGTNHAQRPLQFLAIGISPPHCCLPMYALSRAIFTDRCIQTLKMPNCRA